MLLDTWLALCLFLEFQQLDRQLLDHDLSLDGGHVPAHRLGELPERRQNDQHLPDNDARECLEGAVVLVDRDVQCREGLLALFDPALSRGCQEVQRLEEALAVPALVPLEFRLLLEPRCCV